MHLANSSSKANSAFKLYVFLSVCVGIESITFVLLYALPIKLYTLTIPDSFICTKGYLWWGKVEQTIKGTKEMISFTESLKNGSFIAAKNLYGN